MTRTSFSETISNAKVMLSGIRDHAELLLKRGIDTVFIDAMAKSIGRCEVINNEQEDLKAQLKTKTVELNKELRELRKLVSEASRLIKLTMEQSTWVKFGITATRL